MTPDGREAAPAGHGARAPLHTAGTRACAQAVVRLGRRARVGARRPRQGRQVRVGARPEGRPGRDRAGTAVRLPRLRSPTARATTRNGPTRRGRFQHPLRGRRSGVAAVLTASCPEVARSRGSAWAVVVGGATTGRKQPGGRPCAVLRCMPPRSGTGRNPGPAYEPHWARTPHAPKLPCGRPSCGAWRCMPSLTGVRAVLSSVTACPEAAGRPAPRGAGWSVPSRVRT